MYMTDRFRSQSSLVARRANEWTRVEGFGSKQAIPVSLSLIHWIESDPALEQMVLLIRELHAVTLVEGVLETATVRLRPEADELHI